MKRWVGQITLIGDLCTLNMTRNVRLSTNVEGDNNSRSAATGEQEGAVQCRAQLFESAGPAERYHAAGMHLLEADRCFGDERYYGCAYLHRESSILRPLCTQISAPPSLHTTRNRLTKKNQIHQTRLPCAHGVS